MTIILMTIYCFRTGWTLTTTKKEQQMPQIKQIEIILKKIKQVIFPPIKAQISKHSTLSLSKIGIKQRKKLNNSGYRITFPNHQRSTSLQTNAYDCVWIKIKLILAIC